MAYMVIRCATPHDSFALCKTFMNRIFLIGLVFVLCTLSSYSQGTYIPPKVSEKAVKTLSDAVLSAKGGQTANAVSEIQTLIEKYPAWTEARQALSQIYYKSGKIEEAIVVMEQSIAIDTLSQLQQLYSLGRMYEEAGNFSKAQAAYKSVIRNDNGKGPSKLSAENLSRLEAKTQLYKSNYEIQVTALPDDINSSGNEVLGRWTLDGRSVIFTRMMVDQEDIFIAQYDSLGNVISVTPFSFNTALNEGGHAISPDGKYLIFTSCNRNDGLGSCDLYLAVLKDNVWQKPINMGPAFNSISWDSQPCFGLDGKSIYFSSARPGGFGGRDIWMVYEETPGKWSAPINLGPQINTSNNEASPYIHFDGRTMYFMRDGNEGLGEYDLYISRQGIDQVWKASENMGSPISTPSDEGALSIHPNGKTVIITRKTTDRKNDLFQFELPDKFLATPVQALNVNVADAISNKPLRAKLEVIDFENVDTIRLSQRGDEKGNIIVTLDRNHEYGVVSVADGYIMESVNLPADTQAVRFLEIKMTPITSASEKSFVLENIFFQTGSAVLLKSSFAELKKLHQTLLDNPSMKIEISGHTDNTGTDEVNKKLSEDRAKAVYQYLIEHKIDPTRLTYAGYGSSKPIASNDTEQGRKHNRRTEFRVLNL